MANPFAIDVLSGQQGINRGFANLGGAAVGLRQQNEQSKLMEQQQQRMQEGVAKYQQAIQSNDISAISNLMLEYPELQQVAESAYGFTNDQTKKIATDSYTQAFLNPDQAPQILAQGAASIEQAGGQPIITLQDAESLQGLSPDEVRNKIGVGIASINPELGKQLLGQTAKPMTEYQKVQTDLRRLENQEKGLDRQIKREQNELKKQELQLKLDETRSQKEQSKEVDQTRITDAVQDAKIKQQTIDDLLANDDYISSLSGYSGRLPALTDAGLEAEAFLDNIKNSMTIENLGVMSGPLTDKDIQIIASASSRLRAGMSEKVLKEELNKIKVAYDRVIGNFNKEANRKGYNIEGSTPLAGKGPNAGSINKAVKGKKPITIGRFKVVEG